MKAYKVAPLKVTKTHKTKFSGEQDRPDASNISLKSVSYGNFGKISPLNIEPIETLIKTENLSVFGLQADESASNETVQSTEQVSHEKVQIVETIDISGSELSEDESCAEEMELEMEINSIHTEEAVIKKKNYNTNSKPVDVNADNFFEQINSFIRNESKFILLVREEESEEKSLQEIARNDETTTAAADDAAESLKLSKQQAKTREEEEYSLMKPVFSEDDELLRFLDEDNSETVNIARTTLDHEGLLKDIEKEIIKNIHVSYAVEEHKQLVKETTKFLYELIDAAVLEPTPCKLIDKKQLMKQLIEQLMELKFERKINVFVTHRVIDHHRRKHKVRALAKDDPKTIDDYMQRYKNVLERLDIALGVETDLKEKSEKTIQAIKEKYKMIKESQQAKLKELTELIVNTFENRGEHLKLVIGAHLKKAEEMRDEISAVRYKLRQHLHKRMILSEKLRKLVEIRGNFNMQQYENLRNEIQDLGKSFEERNCDLAKARYNFNSLIHKRAYIKEQQIQQQRQLNLKKVRLAKLLEEERLKRENCVYQKRKMKHIRAEIKEIRFQSGLLEKPALMLDYDETVRRIENVSIRVKLLRDKHDEMIRKIAYFENQCRDMLNM